MNAFHIGSFDAEKYWMPANHAMLPQLVDGNKNSPVIYMDELLFAFTEKGDVLCTFQAFDTDLYEYLSGMGYEFLNTHFTETRDCEIQEMLFKSKKQLKNGTKARAYQPYAITQYSDKVLMKYDLINKLPSIDAVIAVNSKIYSVELANKIRCNPYEGIIVNNIKDLQHWGKKSLEENKIIVIKTPYGVSGNGNIMINDIQMFERIVRHFIKEDSKNKVIRLIIEPYVKKKRDFSAHYYVSETGGIEFCSIQFMNNRGFNYSGSYQSTSSDIKFLHKKGYFDFCEKILNSIFLNGYWGPVCVDSMELENEDVVSLVEINARKSMGLINVQLQKQIIKLGSNLTSYFMFFNIGSYNNLDFKQIYQILKEEKLLFTNRTIREGGIWIISANCYRIDKNVQDNQCKRGRIYFTVVTQDESKSIILRTRFSELLKGRGIYVY
jgi:hypothetical protein